VRRLRLSRSALEIYVRELPQICFWQEVMYIFQKKKRISATCWRTLRSQIIYSPKIAKALKGSGRDGILHISLGHERELELRQWLLERECQLGWGSEWVERWQPGPFSLLFSFFRFFGGSFCYYALFPTAKHFTDNSYLGLLKHGNSYKIKNRILKWYW